MVAAAIRTTFAQPTGPLVREQVDSVADILELQFPVVTAMLRDCKEQIASFADLPGAHWCKVSSTNPPEQAKRITVLHHCSWLNPQVRQRTPTAANPVDLDSARSVARQPTPQPKVGTHECAFNL